MVSAETTLPTCNVSSLLIEPPSELAAIPVVATACLDFQLVPNQRPHTIVELLHAYFKTKSIENVTIERLPGGYPPAHTSFEHPFVQQVCQAGQHIYGLPLAQLPFGPFAQPLFFLSEAYHLPMATVSCAQPDSAIYGPNEHIPLNDLVRHGQLLIELLYDCARNNPSALP